ncbi:MAG: tetracycline resistance efflux pump [Phenylobacterium sp.]|jgi:DHA1 family tetracycline resistance protein-like MFS transporter|nr:tetracycline resistance efflux pump [Phenylobacterium sp.]
MSQSKTAGRPHRSAALRFVFICVLLDIVALGIVIPVLPRLIQDFSGDPASAARYIGLFAAVWALMQFFASPVLGALSDRFGRRPVLLLSMAGLGVDFVFMALAPNLAWLFVGRMISGVTSATYSIANAYVADVTPPDQRAARFGLLSVAFGIGFIIGPAIGGLLGSLDPRLPFWGAAALCLLNALYGLFVLPESLPADKRAPFSFRLANPVGSFDLYRARPGLMGLAGVIFLFYLSHQVLQSTWVPYTVFRYGWSPGMTGISLALVGVASIIVQALVVPRAAGRLGERGMLATGLLIGATGFAAFGWAPTTTAFMATILPFGLMGLVGPGLQGLMSRAVSETEQGRLQGANMGLMAIAGLVGPILFTEVFAEAIGPWRSWAPVGAPFYLAAALVATALVPAFAAQRNARAAPSAA